MSISILISSAILCLIISLILDLSKSSNKENEKNYTSLYSEDSDAINNSLADKVDGLSIKINDTLKIIRNDNTKNAINETNTYIKAAINEIASVKKNIEKISNIENNNYETQFQNLNDKFLALENKIEEIRKYFIDKLDILEDLLKNIKPVVKSPEVTEEDTLSTVDETKEEIYEDKSTISEQDTEEDIDRDFNPGEIDLETTPIETIVENQKTDEGQDVMDSFLEENDIGTQGVEEENIEKDSEDFMEEDGSEQSVDIMGEEIVENDEKEEEEISTEDFEEIKDKEKNEEEQKEETGSEEDTEKGNSEQSKDIIEEELVEEDKEEEDNDGKEDEEDKIEDEEEKEDESSTEQVEDEVEEETEPENTTKEDLATKIKRLKERLNAPTEN